MKARLTFQRRTLIAIFLCATAPADCRFDVPRFGQQQPSAGSNAPAKKEVDNSLDIDDRVVPPKTYLHAQYQFMFRARGNYVPPLHWQLGPQPLPGLQGLRLEDNGELHGEPTRTGVYHFSVSVIDSGNPQQSVRKDFVLEVVEALTLVWKTPVHVSGGRIEGTVQVSNTTPEDIDLTFIVEAVAENGRATAIGYQHFLLRSGTTDMELPFGENLPPGGYGVNVDAIGEVAKRNVIFRRRLQTPAPLQIVVGP